MIRLGKIDAVGRFEFLCTVRSKSWLITTFGMPVFLALYGGLASIPVYLESMREKQVTVFGVVDESGLLGLSQDVELPPVEIPPEIRSALERMGQSRALERGMAWFQNTVYRPMPDTGTARAAMMAGELRGFYRLPPDYIETGVVESWSPEVADISGRDARLAFSGLLVERLLRGKLAEDLAARVRRPIAETRSFMLALDGQVRPGGGPGKLIRLLVPLGFGLLLLISIMMSAAGLIQATATEKENRVVEVLLSCASADEILLGKLLGLGVAGVIQMTIWFGMVALAGVFLTGTLAAIGVEIPWAGIVAAIVLFPLTYLFFGSLMLGTGSIGSTQKEAQQWGMIWTLLVVVPMIFLEVLLREPNGVTARVLTWIPFASPITLVVRLSVDPGGVPWWEMAGGVATLVAGTWLAIRLGARLFRVGILLTGARPKLREILRQARLS